MRSNTKMRWLTPGVVALGLAMVGCDAVTSSSSDPTQGTGSLKVLITDKPFPVGLIEYANVTITKVEVRRAGSIECEELCDDGDFCNGEESCVDGECQDGLNPCAEGEVCDGDNDTCVTLCEESSTCNDGVFCNGEETCVDGQCQSGAPPCDEGFWCDEVGTCSEDCTTNQQCDDGDACNGSESCNLDTGDCEAGENVVCEEGFSCDSETGDCVVEEEGEDEDDSDGSPFVVIFEGERTFNLLDLRNGQTDLLGSSEDVPAGSYSLMRVYVTQGEIKLLDDDRVFTLDVPSGEQTGIKLHFDFDIEDGGETTLLLDVDLTRAFRAIPGGHVDDPSTIREFKFQPSLAMRLINILEAGSISGAVTADTEGELVGVAGVLVTSFDEDGEETTTSTDEDGFYMLLGLLPGSYDLTFVADTYADANLDGIAVNAGETTENQDVTLVFSP